MFRPVEISGMHMNKEDLGKLKKHNNYVLKKNFFKGTTFAINE